jgi:hypothetical protein
VGDPPPEGGEEGVVGVAGAAGGLLEGALGVEVDGVDGAAACSGLGVAAPPAASLPVPLGGAPFPPPLGDGVEVLAPVEDGVVDSEAPGPVVPPG